MENHLAVMDQFETRVVFNTRNCLFYSYLRYWVDLKIFNFGIVNRQCPCSRNIFSGRYRNFYFCFCNMMLKNILRFLNFTSWLPQGFKTLYIFFRIHMRVFSINFSNISYRLFNKIHFFDVLLFLL